MLEQLEEISETSLTRAADALEYSRKLVEIFSRSVDGHYANFEDYAIHKNRHSWEPVPENWMSTPMVPLCISSIFGRAIEQATELEKPMVSKIGHYICADFEKLVKMSEAKSRKTTSLSIAASNASHLLPSIRALL